MKPQVFKGNLLDLSKKRQKTICNCLKPCKYFVTIVGDEDFIICQNQAREHAFEILGTLNYLDADKNIVQRIWTTKEEQYIIDYFNKHGQHDGAYRIIGAKLGRSRDTVKNRVLRMRKEGKL